MKKSLFTLLLLLLGATASAVVVPPLTGRVNDYANVLTDATERRLEYELKQHEDSTSNQIVVVTVASLEGESIESVAYEMFNHWQLGQRGKDNGVLLLVAPNERKVRIEVGYGLEGTLTDAHSARIIRSELTPHFKQQAYDEGITAGVLAIRQAIYGAYSAEDPGFLAQLVQYEGMDFPENLLIGAFVMGILLVFTTLAVFAEGVASWFLFLFLLLFYLTFPFAIFGSYGGFLILAAYVGGFAWIKYWFQTSAGSAWLRKRAIRVGVGSGSGSRSYASSSRRSSYSSSRSSFSGGGGRSGGGGSSGSW